MYEKLTAVTVIWDRVVFPLKSVVVVRSVDVVVASEVIIIFVAGAVEMEVVVLNLEVWCGGGRKDLVSFDFTSCNHSIPGLLGITYVALCDCRSSYIQSPLL